MILKYMEIKLNELYLLLFSFLFEKVQKPKYLRKALGKLNWIKFVFVSFSNHPVVIWIFAVQIGWLWYQVRRKWENGFKLYYM